MFSVMLIMRSRTTMQMAEKNVRKRVVHVLRGGDCISLAMTKMMILSRC